MPEIHMAHISSSHGEKLSVLENGYSVLETICQERDIRGAKVY